MIHQKSNNTGSYCTYPGEYVPAPLTLDEVRTALRQPHEGASAPLVNVVETADAFTVEVAAPGLKSGDFLVSIHQSVLSVSVLHKEWDNSNKTYHQHEFNYCCFKRDLALPENIDTDFLNALYKHGILYVKLPKSKKNLAKEVERVIVY
jgi:HSP20 family protein